MDVHGLLNRHCFIPLFDLKDNQKRLKHLSAIANFNALEAPEAELLQWRNLKKILTYAYDNIPFYTNRFKKAGIVPEDIRSFPDLTKLPILTREDIRRHGDELLAPGAKKDDLIKSATGGTISSPITLYLDRECFEQRLAATVVFNRWFGYELGDKAALLWGATQDFPAVTGMNEVKATLRNYLTSRIVWLPTSYLNDSILAEYYRRICKYQPAVIQAYPTPLYLLAKYMEKNGLTYEPKTITVAAETLYNFQREQIEAQFGCKVFNWYGSRELGHMASECRMHNGLHINTFHLLIEAISAGEQVYETEGNLIVTDLRNRAMPLIRYEIGDMGILTKRSCPCGCGLPLLENVSGRLVDTFVTRSGANVPGVALTNRIIKDSGSIEQMQIVQEDFERFLIRIVKGRDFNNDTLKVLEQILAGYFHSSLDVRYEFVEQIPLEKSGKSRFCICQVKQNRSAVLR
jgi:phenylacetate-CoA ligase